MHRRALGAAVLLLSACAHVAQQSAQHATTFANPLDLDYRFLPAPPSHRTAADPLITLYNGDYYLFASKSGGYWYSPDIRDWKLVVPRGLPIEAFAPSVLIDGKRMYYTAHRVQAIYATDDPKVGDWHKVADIGSYEDPMLFRDDDGKVFLYYGSSLNGGINVVQLDPAHDFKVVDGPHRLMSADYANHGFERSGAFNLGATHMIEGYRIGPYIEGSWLTKHNGTYYLQYSAPGTIWKTYADGVYTATSPLGPFTYARYSPFSYKPGGFIGGAGHGATFQDKSGNYWRVLTMIISVAHKFERRLGIVPAGFDADGVMRTNTYLGDYPQYLPGIVKSPLDHNRTGWLLLSDRRSASASSALPEHPVGFAFDEDIRTQWSARTGNPGEWLRVDLGTIATVNAIQVNFGEVDTKSLGRDTSVYEQYVVEAARDTAHWFTLIDRHASTIDAPHAYFELDEPREIRYLRITNVHAAAGGRFAIRDLRVFGDAHGTSPGAVAGLTVNRDPVDSRNATLSWPASARARSYIVRYGITPAKLYASYEVGDSTHLAIHSLNRGVTYYFTVDAMNGSGITRGAALVRADTVKPITLALFPNLPAGERVLDARPDSVRGPITRITDIRSPTITVYRPQQPSGAAVLVFPGGGYQHLAIDIEGTGPCSWATSLGITCVLVKYRVPQPRDSTRLNAPLQDAQRALAIVRAHAAEWQIDSARIGVLGFSAGAHVAAALSAGKVKPAFAMLIYPAYLVSEDKSELSLEVAPGGDNPPAFLVQAEDDPVGVENSRYYARALEVAEVPVELHVFPRGGHGYGLRNEVNEVTAQWPGMAAHWLTSIGVLRGSAPDR